MCFISRDFALITGLKFRGNIANHNVEIRDITTNYIRSTYLKKSSLNRKEFKKIFLDAHFKTNKDAMKNDIVILFAHWSGGIASENPY